MPLYFMEKFNEINMKKTNDLIQTQSGHHYVYLEQTKSSHLLPTPCLPYWIGEKKPDNSVASQKVQFFKSLQKEKDGCEFISTYSPLKLEKNLANLNHLLIEVTDGCNLACKYCGYGELYGNYDKRINKNNTFENVKTLIDYLYQYWQSDYNFSYHKVCYIGFYGGEPLINFRLIKETIDYIETLHGNKGMQFEYSMTTNALLLDRYMDYLAEKNFHLTISLDGNQFNDSYRVGKDGTESFKRVVENIHSLKSCYPDYFSENVNFNAVLHNRNSVKEIITYIKTEFDKIPTIASLSLNGIRKDKQDEFMSMFRNRTESMEEARHCEEIRNWLEKSPEVSVANYFINSFCEQTYRKYANLFADEKNKRYIPTGTCTPLKRKLFLTVNGKLLACERIGHKHTLGNVCNGKVNIDFEKISLFYEQLFNKIIHLCRSCAMRKGCGMCIYHQETLEEEKIHCMGYVPMPKYTTLISNYLSYFEQERELYNNIMNDTIII